MKRERMAITSLILLLLVLWLGFVVHRSPRFPGSLAGAVLAIAGAVLIAIFSLAYAAAKRVRRLKQAITARVSMRTLLTWHVYTAMTGAILALLHTGHRFQSNLGIALTAMMMIAVLSGYAGRHFLGQISLELHEKQDLLSKLEAEYNRAAAELARRPDASLISMASRGTLFWTLKSFLLPRAATSADPGSAVLSYRAVHLAESIADLEYAIRTHELFKQRFARWLNIHIATSFAFYALLGFHIWASIHFGLRWLS